MRVLSVAWLVAAITAVPTALAHTPPAARAPTPATTQSPAAATRDSGTAAISGVAVDGVTGEPLPGVTVYLGPPDHGPDGQPLQQLTDAKGRFVFGHLPAGNRYFIQASKPGYLRGQLVGSYTGPMALTIALAESQWLRDLKLEMNRGGAISGAVLDERGEPVVGAVVRVLTDIRAAGQRALASGLTATTDDRGMYRIANLTPGTYFVVMPSVQHAIPRASADVVARVSDPLVDGDASHQLAVGRYPTPPRAPDGRPRIYPQTFFPGATTIAGASPIDVSYGQERSGVDLRLAPAPTVRVSGMLDGPPESYTGLTLRLLLPGIEDLGAGSEVATTLVGAGGRFVFLNVPVGSYVLDGRRSVSEYRIAPTSVRPQSLPASPTASQTSDGLLGYFAGPEGTQVAYSATPGAGYWARQTIDVGDTDLTNLAVAMHRGATLRLRGAWDDPAARTPLPPARSLAVVAANGTASLGVIKSSTDPVTTGTYVFEGLLPGEYVVYYSGLETIKSVVCEGRDHTYVPFDASAGVDFPECVITFTTQKANFTGTVTDERHRIPMDAIVIAFPVERAQWTLYGFSPPRIQTVRANTSGGYRFWGMPEGDYWLIAIPGGLEMPWLDPAFLEAAAPLATRASVKWGQTATQNLTLKTVPWRGSQK